MTENVSSDTPRSSALLPHDLLWISGASDLLAEEAVLPDWVHRAMDQLAVVVVRRGCVVCDRIPVGVRGQLRSERFAATVPLTSVGRRVTPEDLVAQRRWWGYPRTETVAALQVLESIAPLFGPLECSWGPTGSVGFELATGVPVATAQSDLDLLIRAPLRLPQATAERLLNLVEGQFVAVDVQIETPFGSVALREYVSPRSTRILIKSCNGPRLVLDPWNPTEGDLK